MATWRGELSEPWTFGLIAAENGIKSALCKLHSACKMAFPAGIEPTAFRLGDVQTYQKIAENTQKAQMCYLNAKFCNTFWQVLSIIFCVFQNLYRILYQFYTSFIPTFYPRFSQCWCGFSRNLKLRKIAIFSEKIENMHY